MKTDQILVTVARFDPETSVFHPNPAFPAWETWAIANIPGYVPVQK